MKKSEQTFYPFNCEDLQSIEDNKAVTLNVPIGNLCGYCALPKTSVPCEWWGNYNADGLQFLKIHGRITYCQVEGDYVVFGFDCGHAGDDHNPNLQSTEYVMGLARTMEHLIIAYITRIKEWRAADTKTRCAIIDQINEDISEEYGFGAILNLLGGSLFGETTELDHTKETVTVNTVKENKKLGNRFDDIVE
jgi:hypothetical protein